MTNAVTLSHTALTLYIRKWRVRSHILNVPLPAVESFAAARQMAELEHNKAFKCLLVLCFTVQYCFVEGTCYEQPAKRNKQWWGATAGLEDDFTAPHAFKPRYTAYPSPLLSHYDYVTHNLGLHHCLESSAYIFQSRELIPYSAHFHVPGTSDSIRERLHYIMLVSVFHATHWGCKAAKRYKRSIMFRLMGCCTCGWLSRWKTEENQFKMESVQCVSVPEVSIFVFRTVDDWCEKF